MLADKFEQLFAADAVLDQRQLHHIHVAEVVEGVIGVIHVGHTARHACGEVPACLTEHYHATARHVFAAVVARTLDDGDGTRVAYAEALAYSTVDIEFTTGGTIESRVAGDDIILSGEVGSCGRQDGYSSS